ncbi:MAG: Testis-specific serine/threonine-protein kinase 4 [Paramarteilia canceri]
MPIDEGYYTNSETSSQSFNKKGSFSIEDLSPENFTFLDTVGRGSYAIVKLALHNGNAKKYAIKIISKTKAPEDFLKKFMPRELNIVKKISHKYRDLKCENILLDENKMIKVTDFGFARIFQNDENSADMKTLALSSTYCGSYAYAAPEILRGIPYNAYLSDVWSLGVILYTLVIGKLPFDDSNHKNLLKQVMNGPKFSIWSSTNLSIDCKSIIREMLQFDVKLRKTICETKCHKWLN